MEENEILLEYQEYVTKFIKKFSRMSRLIRDNEIAPSELNYALGMYLEITQALLTEYELIKAKDFYAELDYDEWYAEKFEISKQEVIKEYSDYNNGIKLKSNQTKPSVKEYTLRLQSKFPKEYREQLEKKSIIHFEMRFILKLLDTMKKYDNVLTTLSNNMRQEMRSLSAINRANADPEVVTQRRVRKGFPESRRSE